MFRGSHIVLALVSVFALNGCSRCSQNPAETTPPAAIEAPVATPDAAPVDPAAPAEGTAPMEAAPAEGAPAGGETSGDH